MVNPLGTTAMGIKAFRMARGLSTDQLADLLGLRRGVIEQIEEATMPAPLNFLAHLRDVLGADLNKIIGVSVPLGRLKANMPGFVGQVTFGFMDKVGGEEAVRRIVKPVRGKLRRQSVQNWHEKRRVPFYAIRQILSYAAENGIALTHEDFKAQRLWPDGSTSWPEPVFPPSPSAKQEQDTGSSELSWPHKPAHIQGPAHRSDECPGVGSDATTCWLGNPEPPGPARSMSGASLGFRYMTGDLG
ncbi:Hypothetical protein RAK1035_2404 [Roseovarius sp. AK1035]|nr:Hypothetical protein RAK1035_2404 [Roseovarius sp. AK1035]